MRQPVKQRYILSYLQYIQWVILVSFLAGCQPAAPFITISHRLLGRLVPELVDRYEAGHFDGDAQLARFVRETFNERLAQKMSAWPDDPNDIPDDQIVPTFLPGRTFIISGLIQPSRQMGLDENFGENDRVKMIVEIVPTQSKGPTHTIHFAYTPGASSLGVQVRSILSGWVESIVNRLYRSDHETKTQLARGKSRYDLQGRTWVEQGEHRKALAAFLQAIDDRPSDHACLYNAGLMCEALGDFRRALGFHKRAQRLANIEDYQLAYRRVETILLSDQVAE